VQLLSATMGLAVGDAGTVLKTTSGGVTTLDVPPAVVAVTPADRQTNVAVDASVVVTFNKDVRLDAADYGETGRVQMRDAQGELVPAIASYDTATHQLTLAPVQPLSPGGAYSVRIVGGAAGPIDLEGRPMVFTFTATFRTGCAIATAGGFGMLIARDGAVRDRIGCPQTDSSGVEAAEQTFERGHMLWRADTREIAVTFFPDGRWVSFPDTYQGETAPATSPPQALLAPERGFGKVWREQPGIRERLGWAVSPERSFHGVVQEFNGGQMLWTGTEQWLIRLYYADGSALVVSDPNQPR
jgi:hypothetical protein